MNSTQKFANKMSMKRDLSEHSNLFNITTNMKSIKSGTSVIGPDGMLMKISLSSYFFMQLPPFKHSNNYFNFGELEEEVEEPNNSSQTSNGSGCLIVAELEGVVVDNSVVVVDDYEDNDEDPDLSDDVDDEDYEDQFEMAKSKMAPKRRVRKLASDDDDDNDGEETDAPSTAATVATAATAATTVATATTTATVATATAASTVATATTAAKAATKVAEETTDYRWVFEDDDSLPNIMATKIIDSSAQVFLVDSPAQMSSTNSTAQVSLVDSLSQARSVNSPAQVSSSSFNWPADAVRRLIALGKLAETIQTAVIKTQVEIQTINVNINKTNTFLANLQLQK